MPKASKMPVHALDASKHPKSCTKLKKILEKTLNVAYKSVMSPCLG